MKVLGSGGGIGIFSIGVFIVCSYIIFLIGEVGELKKDIY